MGTPYSANDLAFTFDGDFIQAPGGDLMDTDVASRSDVLIKAKQAIAHRVMVERNGWSLYPSHCAGLEQFIGQAITPDIIKAIERQVLYTLTFDGLFTAKNLTVKAIDLGSGTEAVILSIFVRGLSDKPTFLMAFDMQTGQISQVL